MLCEGGQLSLPLWGSSEEQLPLLEPMESCSSYSSCEDGSSSRRRATRSVREDSCHCSCEVARTAMTGGAPTQARASPAAAACVSRLGHLLWPSAVASHFGQLWPWRPRPATLACRADHRQK